MKTRAIAAINKQGALLVFPIKNRPQVPSLWKVFYPRTPMLWNWSDDGSAKVPRIWHLREELSRSRKVVYTKWYQGRATLLSFDLIRTFLSAVSTLDDPLAGLSEETRKIFLVLQDDSPLPLKEIKARCSEEWSIDPARVEKSLKELWNRLLITGFGEVEAGGFPSLAMGTVSRIFEDLWDESKNIRVKDRSQLLQKLLPEHSVFLKHFERMQQHLACSADAACRPAAMALPKR
jgi:hypothetical protein